MSNQQPIPAKNIRYTWVDRVIIIAVSILVIAVFLVIAMQVINAISRTSSALPPGPPTVDSVLSEAIRAKDDASYALNTVNAIMTLLQVVGLIIAIFAGLATLIGVRTFGEYREDVEEVRKLLPELRQLSSNVTQSIQNSIDELRKPLDEKLPLLANLPHETELRFERATNTNQIAINNALSELRATINEQMKALPKAIDDAIGNLQRVIAQETSQVKAAIDDRARALQLMQLGQQQVSLGNYDSAMATFQQAAAQDPENRVILYFLADAHLRSKHGELDQALAALRRANDGTVEIPSAKALQAYALRLKGDRTAKGSDEQLESYAASDELFAKVHQKHAELLDTSGESAYGAWGGLYKRRGMLNKAIEIYEDCLKVTPESSYPLINLALIHFSMNDQAAHRDEATSYFKASFQKAKTRSTFFPWDHWSRFDLVTAMIALDDDPTQIYQELENALRLTEDEEAYNKLLLGFQELRAAPIPPKYIDPPISRVERAIQELRQAKQTESKQTNP